MNGTINITIDNKPYTVTKGLTILKAAEQNGIYIPTLCAHKDLTPYGGCRMCLVEVEGARGFLTACTTPVEDGMIVRTHTDQIQKERREILELVLSEHTSSCLICEEKEECKKAMFTIRKAGVTTGCRYCPNDDKCELEQVVSYLGITEINHPVYYRNLPVEKEDPFYDRDYNLCILCGRCVRVCQEVRLANVLAFNQRGRNTVIGPAFNRSHIEAGCEFCGACVSICPTGALAEKSNKWDGVHEREEITTCALCGVGCQMRVLIKNNKVMGTQPAEDNLVNNDQLCVKGRFCVNELVNNYQRLKYPLKKAPGTDLKIKWEEAIEIAAEKLANCSPEEFGMIVSANCTNEDLYIAQKFTRAAMGSPNIDTTTRLYYGAGFNAYLNLLKMSAPLTELANATVILAIGLDLQYGRSVVGVQIRKAIARGAKIITINPHDHSLTLSADIWLQPKPGDEAELLQNLTALTKGKDNRLNDAIEMLRTASRPVVLIGSDFIQYSNSAHLLELIARVAEKIGAGIIPLPSQNNLTGSLLMGTYPELLPGGIPVNKGLAANLNWNIEKILAGEKLRVAYLMGEVPPIKEDIADFLIYQNIYPLSNSQRADLILPAATFTEVDGTFINGEGRIQRVRKAALPPEQALPDWLILCRIAQKMGKSGFDYTSAAEIHEEIAGQVNGFTSLEDVPREATPLPAEVKLNISPAKPGDNGKTSKDFPFILTTSFAQNIYRGILLTSKVEGLGRLIAEEKLIINQEDAENNSLSHGDEVVLLSGQLEKRIPVWISNKQHPGTVHIIQQTYNAINPNPHHVKITQSSLDK